MEDTTNVPRRPDGVAVLAIWYLVLASGAAFGACATVIPAGLISVAEDMPTGGRLIATVLLGFGFTVTLVMLCVFVLMAWGVWNLKEWARVGALFLAILHLPFFPVGTLIGGATLWYLTSHPTAPAAFD